MGEGLKFIGGLFVVIGLVLLFLEPPVGVLILAASAVLGIISVIRTRDARHKELIHATERSSWPAPIVPAPEPQDEIRSRLTNLERLRRDGLISEEEYEAKRSAILNEL